jgi:hypothetical protein
VAAFDVLSHYRARAQRAERRVAALEQTRARLERLLAITARVAAGDECDPYTLLRAIELLDDETQKNTEDYEALTRLLRETAA